MDTILEEQKWELIKSLAQELHVPIPEVWITLEVFDKDGKLIQKHRQRGHSWTRNAYNCMFSQLAGKNVNDTVFEAGKLDYKDTGGTVRSAARCGGSYDDVDGTARGYRGPAGNDAQGILVGSGTDAESFEDYALQTKIANGTAAGQLSYVESEAHSITYNAGTKTFKNTLVRYFNNNSGGDISVNEVGLVGYTHFCGWSNWYVMPTRDKLASTVTIPNTGQLKATCDISLTYPA